MKRRRPESVAKPRTRALRRWRRPSGSGSDTAISSGAAPGRSAGPRRAADQASSDCSSAEASASITGTWPTSASKAGFERTINPASSNTSMPVGLRSNHCASSFSERSAWARATCSAVESCSTHSTSGWPPSADTW